MTLQEPTNTTGGHHQNQHLWSLGVSVPFDIFWSGFMEGKIETGNLHISGVTHFWQLFPLTNNLMRCTIVIMMISLSTVFDSFIKVFDNIIEIQFCLNYNPVHNTYLIGKNITKFWSHIQTYSTVGYQHLILSIKYYGLSLPFFNIHHHCPSCNWLSLSHDYTIHIQLFPFHYKYIWFIPWLCHQYSHDNTINMIIP